MTPRSFFRESCKSQSGSSWPVVCQWLPFHDQDTLAMSSCWRRRFREGHRCLNLNLNVSVDKKSAWCWLVRCRKSCKRIWDTCISPSTLLCSIVHMEVLVRNGSDMECGELAPGRWNWGTNGQKHTGTSCWDILLWGKQGTICLRDGTCELGGDKTSKLNSLSFSLSESFLGGRAEANLCFSSVQCHVGSCT